MPAPEVNARRRDHRVHVGTVSLPSARPVQSARSSTPTADRRRRSTLWLLVSATALVIVGVITAGALSLNMPDTDTISASGVENLSGRDAMSLQCTPRALSESGEQLNRCVPLFDRDPVSPHAPTAPTIESVGDQDADSAEGMPVPPSSPDGTTPMTPSDPEADTSTPGAPSTPNSPGAPAAPVAPAAPAPTGPGAPAPGPASQPLSFAGISENHAIGLLGIRILSSYTLSLSGQPGSTASVTYAGSSAGSVNFDSSGRASIILGGALLRTGLDNPTIRVSYTDGTGGAAIQAPRDSI